MEVGVGWMADIVMCELSWMQYQRICAIFLALLSLRSLRRVKRLRLFEASIAKIERKDRRFLFWKLSLETTEFGALCFPI